MRKMEKKKICPKKFSKKLICPNFQIFIGPNVQKMKTPLKTLTQTAKVTIKNSKNLKSPKITIFSEYQ